MAFLFAILFLTVLALPVVFPPRAAAISVDLRGAITSSGNTNNPLPPSDMVGVLYDFGLALGVLLAFGAIVFGGIKYTISAGNPSQQSDAKDWIKSAILGLILLVGAAFLLNLINPDVFKYK